MDTLKASSPLSSPHLEELPNYVSTPVSYLPEENPFKNIIVDITHQCNMTCLNCCCQNRDIPDMDADWLFEILSRLPQRANIRITGAEATLRKDLPEIIRKIRKLKHTPVLITNGLKLADRDYVRLLKKSGVRTMNLSFNGGFDRDTYIRMDNMDCLDKKIAALENMCAERINTVFGVILTRNVNEHVIPAIWEFMNQKNTVNEIHFRSMARIWRHMDTEPYTLDDMIEVFAEKTGLDKSIILAGERRKYYLDFHVNNIRVQLTRWPDLESKIRGRLAPDGTIQPFFEHIIANDGGY